MENYYEEFLDEIQEAKSMADADYLLGKVAELDSQIDEINKSAQTQLERIGLWQESRTTSIEKQKDYYLPFLKAYMVNSGKKTEKLVNGTLSLRKQQPKIEILDEGLLFESGEFIRTKTSSSIDKAEIRNHIKQTGEIPDGVEFIERDDKFGYKVTV
ncbi:MAG: host-nuclease inhibitor Gam family protein [Candidatus Marinimicrobia bacterium]|nr:host-nuclease inhibitor Gam family protein [Candidatus Neomarinimicrobiota bacterium]